MDGSISVLTVIMLAIASENLTNLFMNGSIFDPIKKLLSKMDFFAQMFTCFLCTSFWAVVFVGAMSLYCPLGKYFILLMLIHAMARYVNTLYIYVLTGTKSTVPFNKPVDFED